MCHQSATVCLTKSPTRQHRAIGPLALRLETLADPRCRRGKRHPFVAVLLVACSAVVAGAKSFAAIGQWAKEAPQGALARLGARAATAFALRIAPSSATVRRVVQRTCPGGLADLLGCDPAGAETLAVDGKSARGSRHGTTAATHLLAAMIGSGQTVTQLRVPDKTNEITCFAALLGDKAAGASLCR
ncbi:transposase family protein [Streptomyces sp. NPDC001832]|uniref:transposase family protein n=1 Tax=Streptomyces sp. NPDC001832 TaxID=3154527 RepID=UPI00332C5B98